MRLSRDCTALPLRTLIDASEQVLGTALQTAVKRADEQAFALANGQNLMFCEKAAAHTLTRGAGAAGMASPPGLAQNRQACAQPSMRDADVS